MNVNELLRAWGEGRPIIWNDPDPIEGNDYTVSTLEEVFAMAKTAIIRYNDGASEAEVPLHELVEGPVPTSQRIEYLCRCQDCGGVMFDYNPKQTEEDFLIVVQHEGGDNVRTMEGEFIWEPLYLDGKMVCPDCLTANTVQLRDSE